MYISVHQCASRTSETGINAVTSEKNPLVLTAFSLVSVSTVIFTFFFNFQFLGGIIIFVAGRSTASMSICEFLTGVCSKSVLNNVGYM